jgi:lipopolysaccharide/colanic/teichoic acid biosynthesis glycosyltransferase
MSSESGGATSSGRAAESSRHTCVGIWQRTLDIVGAGIGLALLVPLMATIALAIKLTSPGPFLFRQTRLSRGRREFTILKFRTMLAAHSGPDITAPHDPRITAVGGFLRRTHLDELPQLVNVLRGDMTLVGPRPETPVLAARYPRDCQWVLEHQPGLTGPTQVRLLDFNAIPVDVADTEQWYLEHLVPDRVAMDATYLDHPTVRATLRVLLDTACLLVRRQRPEVERQPQEGNAGKGASLETPPAPLRASQSNSAALLPVTSCAPSPIDQVSPSSPCSVIDGA